MAATGRLFPKVHDSAFQKKIDIDSDTIKVMLMASYTPSDSHQYVNDVKGAGTEASGTGYSAGGATLASVTWALATGTRANSTAYSAGKIASPGNGHWYAVTTAGTTGGSAPTWPTTDGGTVTDGSVTWTQMGRGNAVYVFDAADTSWTTTGGTLTAKYAVVYDSTPGTDSTNPVIGYINLDGSAGDVTSTNGTFSAVWNAVGIFTQSAL